MKTKGIYTISTANLYTYYAIAPSIEDAARVGREIVANRAREGAFNDTVVGVDFLADAYLATNPQEE